MAASQYFIQKHFENSRTVNALSVASTWEKAREPIKMQEKKTYSLFSPSAFISKKKYPQFFWRSSHFSKQFEPWTNEQIQFSTCVGIRFQCRWLLDRLQGSTFSVKVAKHSQLTGLENFQSSKKMSRIYKTMGCILQNFNHKATDRSKIWLTKLSVNERWPLLLRVIRKNET